MIHYIITLFLFTAFSFGEFSYHLTPHTVSPNIKCFFGLQTEVSTINGANVVNTCYIKTDEGYVVIDSGPTYQYAQQAHRVMQKEQQLPIKYVINTSSNELNSLGNEFYKERGATLVGAKSVDSTAKIRQEISIKNKISKGAFENTRVTPLHISLENNKTLQLGTTTIEIKTFEDKLVIYTPQSKTIFVGDFVSDNPSEIKSRHSSTQNWAKAFMQIKKIPWKHIVSSHSIKLDRYALTDTQNYLKLFQEQPKYHNRTKDIHHKKITPIKKYVDKKVFFVKKKTKPKRTPCIRYTNLKEAKQSALKEHKYVMIKVEADNCNPCKKLNQLLQTNNHIKKMVNRHIKAVKINRDHDRIPTNYDIIVAPTVLLVQPKTNKVLVKLEGSETFEDLEDSLKLFVNSSDKIALR